MNNNTLRFVAISAILSLIGVFVIQIFWFKKAFDLREKQFNQTVGVALQTVGEFILKMNDQQIPLSPLVNQYGSNYFTVQINGGINIGTLEFLLKNEFNKRHLNIDFEYGIYNCESKKMVYGNYIVLDTTRQVHINNNRQLPIWKNDSYYFAVNFPTKDTTLLGQMGIWLFSIFVFILVFGFFVYALSVIFRQKQLSEIQKDFINNMTHEFKTPLSTIIVSTELLKNPKVIQSQEYTLNYLTIIQQEARRIQHQVERVLQIASFDKGNVEFKMERIDLHDCIQQVMKSVELMMKEKKGQCKLNLQAQPSFLVADQLHLTNMIFNLLDNALKYTSSERSPLIEISTETVEKGIRLRIKDNGIGIGKEHLKKVFDRFYRIPTGNLHNVKGFGLGLYYVKMVVTSHKGTIDIQSTEGEGSEFLIVLPMG
ncbi:MAG: sensor histidine kinase [Bacteroidia bacterium]